MLLYIVFSVDIFIMFMNLLKWSKDKFVEKAVSKTLNSTIFYQLIPGIDGLKQEVFFLYQLARSDPFK